MTNRIVIDGDSVVAPAYDELFQAVADGEAGAFERFVEALASEGAEEIEQVRVGLEDVYRELIGLAGHIPNRARRRHAVKRLAMQRDLARRAVRKAAERRAGARQ